MTAFRLHQGSDGTFYLGGELDLVTAERLESEVAAGLDTARDLVLDVAGLTFVDSTGIRAFLRLADRITPRCLVLRRPQPNVGHVLDIVGIASFGIRIEHDPR